MGTSKVRTLLLACVMIMLCAAMIVGGTYALWTQELKVTNHLQSGKLNVTLERISYTKKYLNESGYLVDEGPQNIPFDFSASTSENVFGINEETDKLVPGSEYSVRLKLSNNGDVAFTYDIVLETYEVTNDLADQLLVSVVKHNRDGADTTVVDSVPLSEYIGENGQVVISTQQMAVGDDAKFEFTVKIEFADDDANNYKAQSGKASFDLLVRARQATSAS